MSKKALTGRTDSGHSNDLYRLERAAEYIVKSGLFGVKDKAQAVSLMLLSEAEGLHPMKAIQEYNIIHGRPALKADAMLARFLNAGGKVKWHKLTETECEATFLHPHGGEVTIKWTIEMARKAGLTEKKNKDGSLNNWQKYPRAMLRARVISEGIRTVYPVVCVGVYTPEEVEDFDDNVIEVDAMEVKEETNGKVEQETPPSRIEVMRKIKEIYEKLSWTPEQGKDYIVNIFGKESTNDMSLEELIELQKMLIEELNGVK